MKQAITVLSIIAIAIAVVSFLIGIGSLALSWEFSCELYAAGDAKVIAAGPIVPAKTMAYAIGVLAIAIVLVIFTRASKSIAVEIISIIVLVVTIPVLSGLLYSLQSVLLGQTVGAAGLLALTVATTSIASANGIMAVAEALCLVVCGMSIAQKKLSAVSE